MAQNARTRLTRHDVIGDFLAVKEYLELPDELELHIKFDTNEGFYRSNIPAVMIGVKTRYSRKLLIHESLHAKGFVHHTPPTYQGSLTSDEYSAGIQKEIFGDFG